MTVDEICQKGNRIQQDDIQRLKGMTNKMDDMKEVFHRIVPNSICRYILSFSLFLLTNNHNHHHHNNNTYITFL